MIAQLIDLFKVRIGIMMAITAIAGFIVTPGRVLSIWEIILLALLVLASSASAGAFNQYAERDLDAVMERTKKRPFVTGHFEHNTLWLFIIIGLLAVSVGVAWKMFNPVVAVQLFLGAFFYGVVYTLWLKRRSTWNIVIGGAAGSFAVLAGAAAADPTLSPASILLALVLFLWTPPHFWSLAIALHQDYKKAKVPMLPVVVGDNKAAKIILLNTTLLVAVSLIPAVYEMGLGYIYLVFAAMGGAFFIAKSVQMVKNTNKQSAMACFFSSLVQLAAVLMGAILDQII